MPAFEDDGESAVTDEVLRIVLVISDNFHDVACRLLFSAAAKYLAFTQRCNTDSVGALLSAVHSHAHESVQQPDYSSGAADSAPVALPNALGFS